MTCLSLLSATLLDYSSTPSLSSSATEIGEYRIGSSYLKGYLLRHELPDSLALLAPPPAADSASLAADIEAHKNARLLRDGPRAALATQDADLKFPQACQTFACAMNTPISEAQTPHLYTLLRRTLTDAGLSTYNAKTKYQRARPFVVFEESSCTPDDEAALRKDGSYPSGHSAIGWSWALILAEIAPDRADAILQRGYAFGESRVFCGVHWQSDVHAGRIMGAATTARLHANPEFQAQLQAAKQEVANARSQGLSTAANCQAESQALALTRD